MENMVMDTLFGGLYKDANVFVTGHTGFKGSWLTLWLSKMDARVTGFALSPSTSPNHIELLSIYYQSVIGDIRDAQKLRAALVQSRPEIIFHLAAQPLVRRGYREPIDTFSTNVMGTINLLDICRDCPSVKAVVVVTSDKCYENKNCEYAYREDDPLGGYDPYSASKACAEITASCYRRSYFSIDRYPHEHHVLIATARAGNVIGGGDWSEDRLIPDIMRAAHKKRTVRIRNPRSTRPWQHALESLSGYLMLGQKLLEGRGEFADAWNFGPAAQESYTVEKIVQLMQNEWDAVDADFNQEQTVMHEASLLNLDNSKAVSKLRWKPVWAIEETAKKTAQWYRRFYEQRCVLSEDHLRDYIVSAQTQNLEWAAS